MQIPELITISLFNVNFIIPTSQRNNGPNLNDKLDNNNQKSQTTKVEILL